MAQLLNSLDEAQKYVTLANALAAAPAASVPDLLLQAEEAYLHPAVGAALCERIQAEAETQPNLARLLKRAVANFAVALYVPQATIQIEPNGIVQVAGDKKKSASPEAVEAYRRSVVQVGYHAVESALQFLETNRANYPEWTGSAAYTLAHESLCTSAVVFDQYVHIRQSRRVFLAILPSLREVERTSIVPTLTPAVFDQLRAAPANGAAPDVLRRSHVLPALCHLAYAQALPGMAAVADYGTLLQLDQVATGSKKLKALPEQTLLTLADHHHKLGMLALDRIAPFIQALPGTFPGYPTTPAAASFDMGVFSGKEARVAGFL